MVCRRWMVLALTAVGVTWSAAAGTDLDRLRVKRKEVFAFATPPSVTRQGDEVTITFAVKDYCDVAVAIEEAASGTVPFSGSRARASEHADARKRGLSPSDGSGAGESGRGREGHVAGNGDRHLATARSQSPFPARSQSPFPARSQSPFPARSQSPFPARSRSPFPRVVRHLAAGVLGDNAPEPFQRNAKKQMIVWDGKDDVGRYIDDKDALAVRVSLGLRARFERSLFWSPKKRVGGDSLQIRAAPEGVYVFDGGTHAQLRLFDHQGDYVRTVYPFERGKLDKVEGIQYRAFPPDGERLPIRWGLAQSTFLTMSNLKYGGGWPSKGGGATPTAMDLRDGRFALVDQRLNRLAIDGTTGDMKMSGPKATFPVRMATVHSFKGGTYHISPRSIALSPAVRPGDARWVYMADYHYRNPWREGVLHGVARMPFTADGEAGGKGVGPRDGKGSDPFSAEVFLGAMGRSPGNDDTHFNSPTSVDCDAAGRLYVTDYLNDRLQVFSPEGALLKSVPMTRPALVRVHRKTQDVYVFTWSMHTSYSGALAYRGPAMMTHLKPFDGLQVVAKYPLSVPGTHHRHVAEIDSYADPATIWLAFGPTNRGNWWEGSNVRILVPEGRKLLEKRSFAADARRDIVRPRPPKHERMRLYFDHKNEVLYLGEHHQPSPEASKSFRDLVAIDPKTGRIKVVPIPFDAEDMAFDIEGRAYLRTHRVIGRFDARTWKEIPFDYGQEMVAYYNTSVPKRCRLKGGIPLEGTKGVMFHLGGMGVSPAGTIVVSNCNPSRKADVRQKRGMGDANRKRGYTPILFPGRAAGYDVHVFDRYGRLLYKDAVPGILYSMGIDIDRRDDIYALAGASAVLDGKPIINSVTCTLVKLPPRGMKILATRAKIPMGEFRPKRPPDIQKSNLGSAWVEGAHWLFGGVGFDGKHLGCSCIANSRFDLDLYARSFAPEIDRSRVAVIDTNGNLILRIGKYGNVDDGLPLGTVPLSGPGRKRGLSPSDGSGVSESKRGREGGVAGNGDRHLATARSQSPFPPRSQSPFPAVPRSIGGDEVALLNPLYLAVHTDNRLFISDLGNQRIVAVKLDYHATARVPLKDVKDDGS